MPAQPPSFPLDDLNALADELLARQDGSFSERTWDVHGVAVRIVTDHSYPLECAARLLGVFPERPPQTSRQIRLVLTSRKQWTVPREAYVLPASSHEIIDPREAYGIDMRFARLESINFYEFLPMGGAAYDLERGICVGFLHEPETYRPWLIEHLVLQLLTIEMLRGQGLFWLHAGCVAHAGRAVLVTGKSGSGKTTTCLNLADHGFGFLSEDRVFVWQAGESATLGAYPRDMAVTRETLAILPTLRERVDQSSFTRRKLRVPAKALFPDTCEVSALPGLILFPALADADRTTFHPLSATAALCRILPNSLLASHPGVSARHFEALSILVKSSRAYETVLGRDIDAMPGLVRDLLDAQPG
ncbi:MAG: hypothetical protein KJ626_07790 [Verrucomicrobia bacterium]|nr:hypothetical protein [Verrucomicrobiota bacterium]